MDAEMDAEIVETWREIQKRGEKGTALKG